MATVNLTNSMNKLQINNDVIIYTRTNNKKNKQETICVNYCKQHNFNIINSYSDIDTEHDFNKLQIYSVPDLYSDIIIVMSDPIQLGKCIHDTFKFIERCNKVNIKLHFILDNLTTNTKKETLDIINITCDAYLNMHN